MAVYVWKGLSPAGRQTKGVRDADSPKALRTLLKREGILVTEVNEQSKSAGKSGQDIDFGKLLRRISVADVSLATRQLATLLKSGVPLVESLSALIDQLEHPDLRSAYTQTRDKVNEGSNFADALSAHPKAFSHLYISMVAAGEASGTLDKVLSRLADFLEAQQKLNSKVTGALAYPVIMAILSLVLVLVMLTVVVPKITAIFADFDQALPWNTQLLIVLSSVLIDYFWLFGIMLGLAIWGFRRWHASTKGRAKWDRIVLRLPVFGKLILISAISRFTRTLATLLSSGVPLLSAMDITRNVLGNTELMKVVEDARDAVREGESIAVTLRKSGKFPPIVTQMIAIGEKSGQLEEMLENVANSYDMQVESQVTIVTSLIQPAVILVMGGAAGFIAYSILMPLMQIGEFVG